MDLSADIVLVIHFLYFLFCVGGEAAVLLGALARRTVRIGAGAANRGRAWEWTRNRGFRITHLGAVLVVGIQGAVGVLCPLTVMEYALRRAAGQSYEADIPLVPRIVRTLLFHDFPFWVFTLLYVGFALLTAATYILLPPRRKLSSPVRGRD